MKCECPYDANEHKPNHCNQQAVYLVKREYGLARVCPECTFPEDRVNGDLPKIKDNDNDVECA